MIAATIGIGCIGPLHAQEAADAAATTAAQPAQQPNALQQLFGIKPAPTPAPAGEAAAAEPDKPIALNRYRKASRHSRRH
ncbi:MAG: hypothetical protein WBA29_03490, partial [Xanthobacteraceae bacterium]